MQNPRVNYEMSKEDLETILNACSPVPCIMIGGYAPSSPQENANRAWAALGEKMGFDSMTVKPIPGKGERFFTAVPSETEAQKEDRLQREKEERRLSEIATLRTEIKERYKRLTELDGCQGIDLGDGNFSGCNQSGGDCPVCGA